jgi:malate dehydrogenase
MVKAVVLGAAGGIGQPLSLLLKASPLVDELALFDIVNAPGVATDLSHIDTKSVVKGYLPPDEGMNKALSGADIVVIPAGVPRKPGMTRDDLFKINAGIVRDLAKGIATSCPNAFILVISNPVNSTVPIVAEVLKAKNVFNPKKLFGVTTLDVVRASTFTSEVASGVSPTELVVPVVGGHSGKTIIPLFSQAKPAVKVEGEKLKALTTRVQFGGDEVVKAKDGAGSATLSMAYAGYKFAEAVLKAVKGEKGIVQPSFVYLPGVPGGDKVQQSVDGLEFFSTNVELGSDGVAKAYPLGELTGFEKDLLKEAIPELRVNIDKGVKFITEASKL